jgi:hypothetical protein
MQRKEEIKNARDPSKDLPSLFLLLENKIPKIAAKGSENESTKIEAKATGFGKLRIVRNTPIIKGSKADSFKCSSALKKGLAIFVKNVLYSGYLILACSKIKKQHAAVPII